MNELLVIKEGTKVYYNGIECTIFRIIDTVRITVQEVNTDIFHTIKIGDLGKPVSEEVQIRDIVNVSQEEWKIAQYRFSLLEHIIREPGNFELIKKTAKEAKVHPSTIYRWLGWYNQTGQIISLLGEKKNGGKGKSRLTTQQESIINSSIEDVYLNPYRKSITSVILNVRKKCKEEGIPTPHESTIRRRIANLSDKETLQARYGAKVAKDKFEPLKGSFPHANSPLSVIQIDHTPIDIILVDEMFRNPFNRPYLTLAIDVYSRMVVGLYLSFDPPGSIGTGLCISNAILPKEMYLKKLEIDGDWGCWGVMDTIHVDNAKEFRGNMLRRACENYNINLEFRPPATPEYGGHIERLLGTFSKKIHDLPGTTFSNIQEKDNYDSQRHASLTLEEFEKWLVTFIVNVYHKKLHSGIGMPPERKFLLGVFGDENQVGTGMPTRLLNERKVRLDFMPFFERSIQQYGIVIDHIYYYSDVLRRYINVKNKSNKFSKKYIFRRNPKDISIIYFFDPEINDYYEVPYRNSTYPPISIWEYRAALESLKKENIQHIDEDKIFEAYQKMEDIEIKAMRSTKKMNKKTRRILKRKFSSNEEYLNEVGIKLEILEIENVPQKPTSLDTNKFINLKPSANLDDEAFNP